MRKHAPKKLLFCCVLLLVSGCGFQLRGNFDLPPEFNKVFVESRDPAQLLVVTLMQGLNTSTTGVVTNRDEATAVIQIISTSFDQRTLTFDSRGRGREFELTYAVEFLVTTEQGEYLPRQTVRLVRDYEFDGIDIVAGRNQRETIRDDLEVQMAQSILRRIAAR